MTLALAGTSYGSEKPQNLVFASQQPQPALFQLRMSETFRDEQKLIRRCEFGQPCDKPIRTVMFMGATGAGKTTSLNALVNYLPGVQWPDDFRLLFSDEAATANQAHSQTKWITVYVLHWCPQFTVPMTLVLVDMPGFGDTSGIERDKAIVEQVQAAFQHCIKGLDAVAFVMQSSLPRLTPSQSYVYNSVLALFGRDMASNILVLATFADAGPPKVRAALKEANIPHKAVLKLNNSALLVGKEAVADGVCPNNEDCDDVAFNKMFWDMGGQSFQKFFTLLQDMDMNDLDSTREVLTNRKNIEDAIVHVREGIQRSLHKADCLQQEIAVMQKHSAEISANKDFKYTVPEHRILKHDLPAGVHVTNCLNCNITCHDNCLLADDKDKGRCIAMNGKGYCNVCPLDCHWSMHRNMTFKFTTQEVLVTKTAEDVKQRYEDAKHRKLSHGEMVDAMVQEYVGMQELVHVRLEEVRRLVNRLREMALRDDPLSQIDHLDLMIKSEQLARKPGFQFRIQQLKDARKEAELRGELMDESYESFKDHNTAFARLDDPKEEEEEGPSNYLRDLRQRLSAQARSRFCLPQ